ncbi:FecCD family ABC transporter permease [Marinobacter sp.]|uniref:FecCD family ABC transporter permease n=1 Tax=Marinobacter sp. TaxID=50741 RepID=UPI0034A2B8EE
MDKRRRLVAGPVSVAINPRTLAVTTLLALACLALTILSLSIGTVLISPVTVIEALLGDSAGPYGFIIDTLRLPRVVMAFLVGAALGVSGLILQALVRNPLASPDIIGISGGASVAAVAFLSFLTPYLGIHWLPVVAIAGAMVAALAIYLLAWRQGVTPVRLVLIGIGLSAAMGAATTLMITLSPITTTMTAYVWLTGSVYGSDWDDVRALAPWVLVLLPLALTRAGAIDLQEFGDTVASGLGLAVQRSRMLLLLLAVALAGSAVAYAGAIGFVGLIAPHIARKLVDRHFSGLAPVAAIIGGLLVMIADLIGRTVFVPLDLPAGIFVSAIGAPFFIYLLFRQRY